MKDAKPTLTLQENVSLILYILSLSLTTSDCSDHVEVRLVNTVSAQLAKHKQLEKVTHAFYFK